MSNFILSLIPNALTLLSIAIEFIAKVIMGISILLVTVSVTLHKLFKTKLGISLLEVEKTTNNILTLYANAAKQIAEGKTMQTKESNKLAEAAKAATNVIQLGKKKDDNT